MEMHAVATERDWLDARAGEYGGVLAGVGGKSQEAPHSQDLLDFEQAATPIDLEAFGFLQQQHIRLDVGDDRGLQLESMVVIAVEATI